MRFIFFQYSIRSIKFRKNRKSWIGRSLQINMDSQTGRFGDIQFLIFKVTSMLQVDVRTGDD